MPLKYLDRSQKFNTVWIAYGAKIGGYECCVYKPTHVQREVVLYASQPQPVIIDTPCHHMFIISLVHGSLHSWKAAQSLLCEMQCGYNKKYEYDLYARGNHPIIGIESPQLITFEYTLTTLRKVLMNLMPDLDWNWMLIDAPSWW